MCKPCKKIILHKQFVLLCMSKLYLEGNWNNLKTNPNCIKLDVCLSVHRCICVEKKNQLDVTECFIALMIRSTCFGRIYAHLSFRGLGNSSRAYAVQLWVHRIPQGPTVYTIPVDHGRLGFLWKPHPETGIAKFSHWNFNCQYRVRKRPPLASVLSDKAVSIVRYSTDQKFKNLLDT